VKVREQRSRAGTITFFDFEPTPDDLCSAVVSGLARTPKSLPPKYFYDAAGAELFERITRLDAYYPTRTEIGILRRHGPEIAARIGPGVRLVEFGSGSGEKTWILLDHLHAAASYIPVDISRAQLVSFALRVSEAHPELRVTPICADYTASFHLPAEPGAAHRSVAFFPGSTIGNFEPGEAEAFLRRVRTLVAADGALLIGVDLVKEPRTIERAYNDEEGVTAAFNLNLLRRINRECGSDFDLSRFQHRAVYDAHRSRIEMRLVSTSEQSVRIDGAADPTSIEFARGEHILTEYSHKYTLSGFAEMASRAGWTVTEVWTDPSAWFAVVLLG
jgi:dimethylhistidine N-methyltransferase